MASVDPNLRKNAPLPTNDPLGASLQCIMVMGRLNPGYGEHVPYPMFSQLAALLRQRGFTVIDPSYEGRGYKAATGYKAHVDQCMKKISAADALVLLPDALNGRCATLVAEYAHMVGIPIFESAPNGSVRLAKGQDDLPLWATEIESRVRTRERVLDPMKDVKDK